MQQMTNYVDNYVWIKVKPISPSGDFGAYPAVQIHAVVEIHPINFRGRGVAMVVSATLTATATQIGILVARVTGGGRMAAPQNNRGGDSNEGVDPQGTPRFRAHQRMIGMQSRRTRTY